MPVAVTKGSFAFPCRDLHDYILQISDFQVSFFKFFVEDTGIEFSKLIFRSNNAFSCIFNLELAFFDKKRILARETFSISTNAFLR